MSVYEVVRVCKEKGSQINKGFNPATLLRHICCFGLSLLYSLSGFNEKFSPFGVAFVSCVSKKYTLTATLGACLGYFIAFESVSALRYTSSALALSVILTALSAFKGLRSHPVAVSVAPSVCIFVTGIALVLSEGITNFSFVVAFCEAAICGAFSYVLSKSKSYLTVRGGISTLTSKEITSIIISLSVLLLSFKYATVLGVSLAHILSVCLILLCSYYGKESGGAVVGICCGLAMSFGTNNLFLLSFYALGGLISGAFSSYGRFASLCAFSLSGVVVGVVSGYSTGYVYIVIEALISAVFFFIITHWFDYQLTEFFTPSISLPVVEAVKSNIINKLHRASEFSSEICSTLDSVNNALSKSENSNVDSVPYKVKSSVCGSCGLYNTCWNELKEEMSESFNNLLELKKQGIYLEYKTTPVSFSSMCIRTENISSTFNKYFSEYKVRQKTENRIKEIQTLASEQFVNVSDLLNSLCDELDEEIHFDVDIASRCKAIALSNSLEPLDCCCISNNIDKLTIELRLKKSSDKKILNSLSHQLSVISGRKLDAPEIDEFDDYIKAIYREKADFKVVSAGVQFNANGEKYSGDTYTTFQDEKGYFYAIICDGMGTGSRAAVSSSLAVTLLEKLIMAGFGVNSAITTVNTSLISKSGDECSVTLDLVCIDLFTGKAEFYKCGAQNTLVKRHGKISTVGFDSLPLGIISDITVASGGGIVGAGDVIIMCSDGVREEDFWQLRNALKVFDNGNVRNFTTEISEIIRRSQPEKNDDFTMLTLAITKGLE